MKKIVTFLMIAFLLVVYSGCLIGCTPGDGKLLDPSEYEGEIWSTPSTVKVARDDIEYENKGPAAISVTAVKNEYESYQLYITPKSAVNSFYLATSNLSDGNGHTFGKSNITVYYQKCVPALNEKIPYRSAWYPDPLIPIDNAKDAGELTIDAEENGSLWITFYIPKDTVPGIYTANFTLEINEASYKIPVTLKVYDYELTDEIHALSSFNYRPMYMAGGELDCSQEMREKYFDFFLDYRLALRIIPTETSTIEERVEAAKKNFDRVPCFGIYPEDILPLAEASSPEKNLLSKAVIQIHDEPYMWHTGGYPDVLVRTKNALRLYNDNLTTIIYTIANDTKGKYDSFKQIENWQDVIRNIVNIIPEHFDRMILRGEEDADFVKEYLSLFNGYCALWNTYDDTLRDQYLDIVEEYGATQWWYGCLAPTAPYATYHIADTNLLSCRTITWMKKKYDITGTVYWGTALCAIETKTRWSDSRNILSSNPYENVYRIGDVDTANNFPAGDGILVYPGAAYGVYGPLPTNRIMSIRDGFEEYEMLLDLENKYQEIVDSYADKGESIDVKDLMEELYKKIYFNGVMLYADGERGLDFSAVREALIEALVNINDPCQFLMKSKVIPIMNKAIITLYADSDYEVKVNGETLNPVQGSEVKYVYEMDLAQNNSIDVEVKHSETGETYNYSHYISLPFKPLMSFDSLSEVPENIKVTKTSSVEINEDPQYSDVGKSLKFTIKPVIVGDPALDTIFTPSIKIPVSLFQEDVKFTDMSILNFFIYNPGDQYVVTVKLYSGGSYALCGNHVVAPGQNKIVLSIDGIRYSRLDRIDTIAIEFENAGTQYVAYIDSMYAEMK